MENSEGRKERHERHVGHASSYSSSPSTARTRRLRNTKIREAKTAARIRSMGETCVCMPGACSLLLDFDIITRVVVLSS